MCSNANDLSDYESEGREFESLPAHHASHRGRDASVHFLFVSLFSKRTNGGNHHCEGGHRR